MPEEEQMRRFWDAAAAENALWYVHSELDFASPDVEEFWKSGEVEVARALRKAGVERGHTAIDIGCGVGRLSRALAGRFERVMSFDVSPRMVELAQKNLAAFPGVTVAVAKGDGGLDVPSGEADLVLSLQVFQHIPFRAATLTYIQEAGRALKPGGAAVFQFRSLLARGAYAGALERLARAVVEKRRRAKKPPPAALDSPAWHGSRIGLWQIRRAAAASGMRIEWTRWISRRGASLFVVCRKRSD